MTPGFRAADAARLLCVSTPTIASWVRKGHLVSAGTDSRGRKTFTLPALLAARVAAEAAATGASGVYVPRRPYTPRARDSRPARR